MNAQHKVSVFLGGASALASMAVGLAVMALLVCVGTASADLKFETFSARVDNTPVQKVDAEGRPVFEVVSKFNFNTGQIEEERIPVFESSGTFDRQAGSHQNRRLVAFRPITRRPVRQRPWRCPRRDAVKRGIRKGAAQCTSTLSPARRRMRRPEGRRDAGLKPAP